MSDPDADKEYQTLTGVLAGEKAEEPFYFSYSATLRIFGTIPDLDQITQRPGISPTKSHRRGDRRTPTSEPYKHDMWLYKVPVNKSEPLHLHIDSLWNLVKGGKEYLLQLKEQLTVDVFLGYRSNCDHAGVEVPYLSLAMFVELQVPFGVSIIVT
jgi:hypothetical protein